MLFTRICVCVVCTWRYQNGRETRDPKTREINEQSRTKNRLTQFQ